MTPWTVVHKAPPSVEFSRQEYWSRLPFSCLADLPAPGIKHGSPTLWADASPSEPKNIPLLKTQNNKAKYPWQSQVDILY